MPKVSMRLFVCTLIGFILSTHLQGQNKTHRIYSSPNPMYKFNIDTAYALFDNGRYAEAIPFLQAALKITDKSYLTKYKLATAFNKTGQTDKCFEILFKMSELNWDWMNTIFGQENDTGFLFANLLSDKRWTELKASVAKRQEGYKISLDTARILLEENKYKEAIPYLQVVLLKQDNSHANEITLATAYNKTGQASECFVLLNKIAIDYNWIENYIANDTAADFPFANLVDDKRWTELKMRIDSLDLQNTKWYNRKLRAELKEIEYTDQHFRGMLGILPNEPHITPGIRDSLWRLQDAIDSANLIKVIDIFDKYGYPGDSLVGSDCSDIAWLVIQHAGLEYQEKYLPLIKEAGDRKQLSWVYVAYLIDRIEMRNGRPQIYGSQLNCDLNNNCTVYKIKDDAHVDERRAQIGLPPLEEYVSQFGIKWAP
jgi:tetratricopeptide (TPR) repeat protein